MSSSSLSNRKTAHLPARVFVSRGASGSGGAAATWYLRDGESARVPYQLSAVHIKCDQSPFFALSGYRRSSATGRGNPFVRTAIAHDVSAGGSFFNRRSRGEILARVRFNLLKRATGTRGDIDFSPRDTARFGIKSNYAISFGIFRKLFP